jgi:hypothetical protein
MVWIGHDFLSMYSDVDQRIKRDRDSQKRPTGTEAENPRKSVKHRSSSFIAEIAWPRRGWEVALQFDLCRSSVVQDEVDSSLT